MKNMRDMFPKTYVLRVRVCPFCENTRHRTDANEAQSTSDENRLGGILASLLSGSPMPTPDTLPYFDGKVFIHAWEHIATEDHKTLYVEIAVSSSTPPIPNPNLIHWDEVPVDEVLFQSSN